MPSKYVGKTLIPLPYQIVICLSSKDFLATLKKLKVDNYTHEWVVNGKAATVHFFSSGEEAVAVLCMDTREKYNKTELYCLFVHEAVHIWQANIDMIGEDKPSDEFMAYAIQVITLQLIMGYESMKRKRK